MNRIKNRISAVFCALAVVLCFAGAFMCVSAKETGSLTLWCVNNDEVLSGMQWQIYRVGHREADDYVFEGDFADCRVTLGDPALPMTEWDAQTVSAAANALKLKTIADQMTGIDAGETDENGKLTFDHLEDGLYLVWGKRLIVGDTIYIPESIFFEMSNGADSELNIYPKIVLRVTAAGELNYSVKKVWLNDEHQPQDRSAYIIVERYRDHQLYDEIRLSEENDWTFTWTDDQRHDWQVIEKEVPAGYTVSYQDNEWQYLIVNTYTGSSTGRTTTVTTGRTAGVSTVTSTRTTATSQENANRTTNPPGGSTGNSSGGGSGNSGSSSSSLSPEKLPQTGQLWWPVWAMSAGGVLCFGAGFLIRKKNDEE